MINFLEDLKGVGFSGIESRIEASWSGWRVASCWVSIPRFLDFFLIGIFLEAWAFYNYFISDGSASIYFPFLTTRVTFFPFRDESTLFDIFLSENPKFPGFRDLREFLLFSLIGNGVRVCIDLLFF